MAENIAHTSIFESATDGATFAEIDGAQSYSRDASRTVLEVTPFKDATGHKIKIMGRKDGGVSLGGQLVLMTGTLSVDTGIKNVMQRARDGGALTLRTKVDGVAGTYRGAACVVTEFGIKAEVDGTVEWSATLKLNGAAWA